MEKNWSVREYIDGDEENINDLFNIIFEKNRKLNHWEWEFKKNPKGSKSLVAVDNDQIVGHLGSLHRNIKAQHLDFMTSWEVVGMTHTDFGRLGIFVALGQNLLAESRKEGIDIVIGFPNENALPGHRKLGCIELFSLHVMIKPINFKNLSKKMFSNRLLCLLSEMAAKFTFSVFYRTRKPKITGDVTYKTVSEFNERFDKFWEEAKVSYPIILTRDSRYMNWRYAECPSRHYQKFAAEKDGRILAVVIVSVLEKFGLSNGAIVDILALPNHEHIVHELVLKAGDYLKEKKVDLIACSVPKWSSYNNVLKKCGFMKCPKRLYPKEEPFIIYPLSKEIDIDLVKNPLNWYITWGDTDVV